MSRRIAWVGCAALSALVAACNRTPRSTEQPRSGAPIVPAQSTVSAITLERLSCYGTCPVYKVTLQSDGVVRFEGTKNVTVIGTRSWRVSADSAATAFLFADSIRFGALQAKFDFGEPGCSPYITDHPALAVTLERSGTTKRVYADEGCRNLPASLLALGTLIDRVARVESSVGKP